MGNESFFNPWSELQIHERHLPHWQQSEVLVFVTWHLADSLPASLLGPWRLARAAWMVRHPRPWSLDTAAEYRRRFGGEIERWLDAGHGSCVLREAHLRRVVEETLRAGDGRNVHLRAWVIMPNHVHVLLAPIADCELSGVLKAWKGVSARRINQTKGKHGPVWHEEYWDRLIRDEVHLARVRRYIADNPARARLNPGDYSLWLG